MTVNLKKNQGKKGVSYLVTVVLMTLIAVALSTLLYAYFSGWIGEKTGVSGPVGALSVDAAYAVKDSSYLNFTLYVRNSGSGAVNITKALLTAPNGTIIQAPSGSNVRIEGTTLITPGNSSQIKISVSTSILKSGTTKGLWTIKLLGDDGSVATVNIRVNK